MQTPTIHTQAGLLSRAADFCEEIWNLSIPNNLTNKDKTNKNIMLEMWDVKSDIISAAGRYNREF